MLDQFINSLPKTVLALIAIVVGFFIIVQTDPPRTLCDAQMDLFKKQQQEFIYGPDEDSKSKTPAQIGKMYTKCQETNSPGGCFEYFVRLKKLNQDLELIPKQCAETAADDDLLKKWLQKSMKLMAQISWGDRGPASVNHRNGWFDESDLSIYCGMHRQAVGIYGVEEMDKWRDGVLDSLPESEKMDHDSLYQKSLLSTSCDAYR